MSTIVTRTSFCKSCYDAGRPKLNDSFLIFGTTSNKLKIIKAEHYGLRGYVPHLFRLCKVQEDKVYYQTFCCFCGSYWETEIINGKEARFLYMDEEFWSGWRKTTLSNWNACVKYKHDKLFEI